MPKKSSTKPALYVVTGASGFIGKHVVDLLLENPNNAVLGVVSHFRDYHRHARYIPIQGDLTIGATWKSIDTWMPDFKDHAPTCLIHLAGPTNRADLHSELKMYDYYTKASVYAARFANRHSFPVLFASSGKVYGNSSLQPIPRLTPREPTTILGKAKAIGEDILATLCDKPVKIARIFNVFGPGQKFGYLFPTILGQINLEKTAIELDAPEVIRDFLHVRRVAEELMAIISYKAEMSAFNVASGVSRTPTQIVNDISALTGLQLTVIGKGKYRSEEAITEYVYPWRKLEDTWMNDLRDTLKKEIDTRYITCKL